MYSHLVAKAVDTFDYYVYQGENLVIGSAVLTKGQRIGIKANQFTQRLKLDSRVIDITAATLRKLQKQARPA